MAEPRRLLEGAQESELTRALRAARTQLGAPEQMGALHARLTQRLRAGQVNETGALQPSRLLTVKAGWSLGAVLVGLGIAAVFFGRLSGTREPQPAVARSSTLEPDRALRSRPTPAHAVAVETNLGSVPPEVRLDSVPRVARPAPRVIAALRLARPNANAASGVREPFVREAVDPDAEVALISSAQQALDRDPQRALAALDEHAQRFAHGFLSEEREILRFDALVSLGRSADALASARSFVTRFPRSPQRARLAQWLALQNTAPRVHNASEPHIPTE